MAEGRGGVVKKFLDHTTPSARTNEASRLFLIVADPPLLPAEEGSRLRLRRRKEHPEYGSDAGV